MFHSVKDAWRSASKCNMADVKELIPEFFYLPEMFLNSNNFDLGVYMQITFLLLRAIEIKTISSCGQQLCFENCCRYQAEWSVPG